MKGWLNTTPSFKSGDPCPQGYIARQEWANVQLRAGSRQARCGFCSGLFFPLELSGEEVRTQALTSRGLKVNMVLPICKKCAELRK